MMRNSRALLRDVLVVESPNKVKTISKLLQATKYSGTAIVPSAGHVCEMRTFDPISFEIERELMDGKGTVLDKICREWDGKGTIYLALDPDREGEVMAHDLYTMLTADKDVDASALQRVSFNEVTGAAVTKALENPSKINEHMVHAGLARSVIDYWFGMAVSRHIQKGVKGARSAGRVQTPALGLVADRDAARQGFKRVRFYTPRVRAGKVTTSVKLANSGRMTEEQAKMVVDHIKQHNEFQVSHNTSKSQGTPPPFLDTAGSLKEASKSLRVSTADVTKSLQRLFEKGLITYPRTDSTSLSKEGMDKVHKAIRGKFGDAYVLEVQEKTGGKPKKGPKMTQEAHEAIRPTDMSVVRVAGSDQEQKLYEFLWRRTMEAAMPRPIFHVKTTTLTHPKKLGAHKVSATLDSREMVFDGSNILRGGKSSSSHKSANIEGPTCNVSVLETVKMDTSPPGLLTEGDLIEDLKRKGIGRPSTYKNIIDKIGKTRGYVNVNAQGNVLDITQRGGEAIKFMRSQYPHWVDYGFTARLEKNLNLVANGELPFKNVMSDFRRDLGVSLADNKVNKAFYEVMETDPETGLNVYKKTNNYQLGEVGLTRVLPLDAKDLSLDAFLKHGKVHQSPTPWAKKDTKTAKSA